MNKKSSSLAQRRDGAEMYQRSDKQNWIWIVIHQTSGNGDIMLGWGPRPRKWMEVTWMTCTTGDTIWSNMIKQDSNNELLVTPGEVHQTWWTTHLPSGRRLQFAMKKSIVCFCFINQLFQWAIFNSYVSHYQRVHGHRSSNHDCKRENRHKNKLGNWTWQEDNGEGEVAFKSWTATWSSRL